MKPGYTRLVDKSLTEKQVCSLTIGNYDFCRNL